MADCGALARSLRLKLHSFARTDVQPAAPHPPFPRLRSGHPLFQRPPLSSARSQRGEDGQFCAFDRGVRRDLAVHRLSTVVLVDWPRLDESGSTKPSIFSSQLAGGTSISAFSLLIYAAAHRFQLPPWSQQGACRFTGFRRLLQYCAISPIESIRFLYPKLDGDGGMINPKAHFRSEGAVSVSHTPSAPGTSLKPQPNHGTQHHSIFHASFSGR